MHYLNEIFNLQNRFNFNSLINSMEFLGPGKIDPGKNRSWVKWVPGNYFLMMINMLKKGEL